MLELALSILLTRMIILELCELFLFTDQHFGLFFLLKPNVIKQNNAEHIVVSLKLNYFSQHKKVLTNSRKRYVLEEYLSKLSLWQKISIEKFNIIVIIHLNHLKQ